MPFIPASAEPVLKSVSQRNLVPQETTDRLAERLERGHHPSSMVDEPAGLFRFVFATMLRSVDFAKRIITSFRDAEDRGTVVYVMRTRSIIDYLYFNLAFREHGLKLVRFANGVKTYVLRGFWRSIGARLRGRRGLPNDEACLEAAVAADLPAMIFLRRPRGKEIQEIAYALPYLQRLVQLQRRREKPLILIPTLLVWDKRPEREHPSVLDDVFGSRHKPGFIKQVLYVIQNFWQSFLNLGRPTVQRSSEIDLKAFVEHRKDLSDVKLAQELRAILYDALNREERIVVGPLVKRGEQMRREILADGRLRKRLEEQNIDLADYQTAQKSQKILREIAADFSPLAIKSMSAMLHPIWNIMYDGIEIDAEGMARVREAARSKRLVIVPSHKSHIDYLVISYVFYNNGLIPPHIAAGVNLSFWPLGTIFRRSGAFFLRRTFSDDPLYATLFRFYIIKLIEEGFPIEFFIEGTRSRTGKLAPPKYGMLDMIVDAFRGGNVNDLAIIPVSVGYEKIIEADSYRKELEGSEKKSENLGGLLQTTSVLRSRYGRIHVDFGNPIDLGEYLDHYHAPGAAIEHDELRQTVRRLAYKIIHGINDATTVTPSAIVALVMLNSTGAALDLDTLTKQAGFVIGYLQEEGVRFSKAVTEPIQARLASIPPAQSAPEAAPEFDDFDLAFLDQDDDQDPATDDPTIHDDALGNAVATSLAEAIALLKDNQLVQTEIVDGVQFLRVPDDRRIELAFYKNNILHYFADDSVFATALYAARNGNGQAADAKAREEAQFLSQLLKYEFCFNERGKFDQVFDTAAQTFIDFEWIARLDQETYALQDPPCAGFEFTRAMLLSILESYYLAALVAAQQHEWIDPKALSKKAIAEGRAMHLKGELDWPESRAQSTLDSAFRILRDWGAFENAPVDSKGKRSRDLRLNPAWKGEKIQSLLQRLQHFLVPQQRRASTPLRRTHRAIPESRDEAQVLTEPTAPEPASLLSSRP